MNTYYLIPVEKVKQVKQYAVKDGLPHQLFHYALTEDGKYAIVQAEWVDEKGPASIGTRLGERLPDGRAEEAVRINLASLTRRDA